uniref:thymosin beta-4-like n=1 Tax=Jaculus jaculus TaxID=51337 RepID=UPI001E1B535F|nr:thymosin beta-4-like [Jaculus jaculus]
MSDRPDMAEMEKFRELKLKKAETQEQRPQPSKEAMDQERRAGERRGQRREACGSRWTEVTSGATYRQTRSCARLQRGLLQ